MLNASFDWGTVTNLNFTLDIDIEDENAEISHGQTLSPVGYFLSAIFLFVIWIFGSLGNFAVVFLVAKNKQLQTSMNVFLVNLSIADFCTSAVGSPMTLTAAVMQGWPFGHLLCSIYAFVMALGGITSITTLMVLAFERFLMIARPFRANDIRMHHSILYVIVIWTYSLILTLPPLFGWAEYGPEGPNISCSVSWEKKNLHTKSYIVFLFVMGLVFPLTTIVISYVGIICTLKVSSTPASRTANRAEMRIMGMVLVMVSFFLLAWLPYAVVSLIVAFSESPSQWITPAVAVMPALFAKSSTCYNPFIYVGLNTQFRSAWLGLFGRKQNANKEDEQTQTLQQTTTQVNFLPNKHNSIITEGERMEMMLCSYPKNGNPMCTEGKNEQEVTEKL